MEEFKKKKRIPNVYGLFITLLYAIGSLLYYGLRVLLFNEFYQPQFIQLLRKEKFYVCGLSV